jgi:hypothetical protein
MTRFKKAEQQQHNTTSATLYRLLFMMLACGMC